MRYKFEWDPVKAKSNFAKHKIQFDRPTQIFRDLNMVSVFDAEHSDREDRWITLGRDGNGVLLVVSHTFVEERKDYRHIRLISARKATKRETSQYERA